MITIDRDSSVAVHEQLADQLRYLIASGHYQVEETLPSTRALGKQLGISFHTVRKAYQQLEQEGLLVSKVGSGFSVIERAPLKKSERIERGAIVVEDSLQRLIALGLTEHEVEYLFQEQFNSLSHGMPAPKILCATEGSELAEGFAEQLAHALQQAITPCDLSMLDQHPDVDVVLAPYSEIPKARGLMPRADTVGFVAYFSPEVLESVSRLRSSQTLGLVTRHADAISPLTRRIKWETGYTGQTLAISAEIGGGKHLSAFVEQTDLLLFTPPVRRRLLPHLGRHRKSVQITSHISKESLSLLREMLPK